MNNTVEEIKAVTVKGGYAKLIEIKKGQLVKITDIEGGQVADLFAYNADNYYEKTSPAHTIMKIMSLKMKVGDKIYSNYRHPMLEIIDDTAGTHDLLMVACDSRRYLYDYNVANHRSCVDNITDLFRAYGISPSTFPNPINLFQKTEVTQDGKLIQKGCPTKPGDFVLMKAHMNLLIAISACPMDLNPIGGDRITDIGIKVYE